jgi:tetratricopeptide (TPR) repeat protein
VAGIGRGESSAAGGPERAKLSLLALSLCLTLVAALGPARSMAARHDAIQACYDRFDGNELHLTGAKGVCPAGEHSLRLRAGDSGQRRPFNEADVKGGRVTVGGTHVTIFGTGKPDRHKTTSEHLVTTFKNVLLLAVVGAALVFAAVALFQALLGLLGRALRRFPAIRDLGPLHRLIGILGPVLQVQSFENDASSTGSGASFASKVRAQLSKRETGEHLFLVTGEGAPSPALSALQAVPQGQLLAAAVLVLRGLPFKSRLVVTGSLTKISDDGAAAAVLILQRGSRVAATAEIRPTERPSSGMSPSMSNDVLAVAAAGWAEHVVADETPGPPGHRVFLSHDPLSWAFFRAGATLSRRSYLAEAGDAYERALAIDPENIGALVDLAHLRRREGHFPGAASLAKSAIELIEARRKPKETVPDWYRAMIVLGTIYSEWAKQGGEERHRDEALRLSIEAFSTAAETRDWIEGRLGRKALKKARSSGRVPRFARSKAWLQTRFGRWRRWSTAAAAAALYELLETTFEPGALLLVAANCGEGTAPPAEDPFNAQLEMSPEARERKVTDLRETACEVFKRQKDLDSRPLIEYVNALTNMSPRVLYNLACHYSEAAGKRKAYDSTAETYTTIAAEYLRQAISRFPPAERRGVLDWVHRDTDLKLLRERRRRDLFKLRSLIPE